MLPESGPDREMAHVLIGDRPAPARSADAPCRIWMLGGLEVDSAGRTVCHFETRQTGALLARLAYPPGRAHLREALAELLWPEEDPEATRGRLRQALAALRRVLEPEGIVPGTILVADRAEVRLAANAVATDV